MIAELGTAGGRLLQAGDPEVQRRELLAELIVHLARDAPPLVLLREDHAGQQFRAGALFFRPLPRRQIEMGSDDADDRPARLAACGIAA